MSTNKIALRTVEEFMSDYTPVYQPIYPLFMGKSQSYAPEAGKLDFRRVQTVGDIRAKHITPKDTEMRQIAVLEGKKTFKKYFMANQFTLSAMQSREGVEEVVAQVLDEHQIQADELFLTSEGTTVGTEINNGLFLSSDSNYTLKTSYEIPTSDRLHAFYTKVQETVSSANQLAGRKVIFFYGNVKPLVNSLFPNSDAPVKSVMQQVLGANYSLVEIPDAPTPASSHGWIIANLDQCKLHMTALPQLLDQGSNNEKMYLWFNFMMGSMMLEVLAKDGIIRQPSTLAV
jgi:hypothetical protein